MVESVQVPKTIRASIGKGQNECEYQKLVEFQRVPGIGRIRASTGKRQNPSEYLKMVESGRVPRKGRIRATIEKLSEQVPENGRMSVSTKNWQNPGEQQEKLESMRVSKNCTDEYRKGQNQWEYRKMVEFGRLPGKGRIRATIEQQSGRVSERVESL